jgi:flagellin-specific chaperone FliS
MKKSAASDENGKAADSQNKVTMNTKSKSVLTLFDACNKSLKDLQSLEKKTSNKLKELEKMVF